MSRNTVLEGWLTKSPPANRIFKTKWRRRWFCLRQSGDLPGQYFLDYYSDRSCRRLKGSINLDLCEQVDAGLHMTRNSNGFLDPRMRGSVFSIQTQSRTYHLEADCEAAMEKWVDAICQVCGLRATIVPPDPITRSTYQSSTMTVMNDQYEFAEGTGPYIPISECITGVRAPDSQRTFTFDPNNIIIGSKSSFDAVSEKSQQIYHSHPQIRVNNVDFSENESNLSDEECKSLNASQSNIENWSLARTYVRPGTYCLGSEIRASGSGSRSDRSQVKPTGSFNKTEKKPSDCLRKLEVSEEGPPVPPRPPKTKKIGLSKEHRESFQEPKPQEPEGDRSPPFPWLRSSRRMSHKETQSVVYRPKTDDEDDCCLTHSLQQYCNLTSLPPFVDRALKPRIANSVGHVNCVGAQALQAARRPSTSAAAAPRTSDALQYLDLDLSPKSPAKTQDGARRANHAKSFSESRADYKTVDFVKTEAFNITRQDAEASRSVQQ